MINTITQPRILPPPLLVTTGLVAFPPNTFTTGDTNYFYLEFSDGIHDIEAPELDSPWWYKDHCSFYIE